MPRIAAELGALAVSRIKEPGRHEVGGVPGLALRVAPTGSRAWVLRAVVGTRRREIGLGPYPGVPLVDARRKARELRELIVQGVDPVDHRTAARSALIAEQAKALTFEQCAERYIEAHEAAWRSSKHGQQWRNTLKAYAYPVIGDMLVSDVQLAHVLRVLEPIWQKKTETASRLRGRIESVLDWAKGRGYRQGDNPAAWKGNLDAQLPKPGRVAKVEHHAALPIDAIGAFMVDLRHAEGVGAQALEFVILTAARSGEVRGATWAEIDMDEGVWAVPAGRMKAGREHRVPLSDAALDLLRKRKEVATCDLVFESPLGKTLSDMTLTAVLRRMGVDATVHGFRSTFRDWAAERTHYPSEMAEMALAHTVSDKVEAAYRRGDMFEKRLKMMQDWADFVGRVAPSGNVVELHSAVAA